jgi:putative hydrolase of HD superfamily
MDERLSRQMEFLLECDKSKQIVRQTYLANGSRKENDAEHAWHLALMTFLLAEYANEPIDVLKTVEMVLVHDLVEIDAGDTYAYDAQGNLTKRARELAAAERLFGLLPDDQREKLRALWDEFEAVSTPEARFAAAMDHIQPLMLNAASQGKSWLEHGVAVSSILRRNEKTPEGSEALWDYAKTEYLDPSVKAGYVVDDRARE